MNVLFIDIAGFGDTGGVLIELVNSFVDKYLFMNAKSIKFLLPITLE
jgi:hypothetical protein